MSDFIKAVCLILLSLSGFCLSSEENQDVDDEVLTVRTQFPRYRVLYNHQQVIQEVQNQLAEKEESSSTPSEKEKK